MHDLISQVCHSTLWSHNDDIKSDLKNIYIFFLKLLTVASPVSDTIMSVTAGAALEF